MSLSILRWSKADVASILGNTSLNISRHLPDDVKEQTGWKAGKCFFDDVQVKAIIKHFRKLANDKEIHDLIYPKGY